MKLPVNEDTSWHIDQTLHCFATADSITLFRGSDVRICDHLGLIVVWCYFLQGGQADLELCLTAEKAGPLTIYEGMVLRGNLHHDANQHKVAVALDELLGQMREHELQMKSYHVHFSYAQ